MKDLRNYILESGQYEELSEQEAKRMHSLYGTKIVILGSDYDINNDTSTSRTIVRNGDDFDEKVKRYKNYYCHGNIVPKFYIEK